MVSLFLDCSRRGKNHQYKTDISCFSAEQPLLVSESKDWSSDGCFSEPAKSVILVQTKFLI